MKKKLIPKPALALLALMMGAGALSAAGPHAPRVAAPVRPAQRLPQVAAQSMMATCPMKLRMAPRIRGRFANSSTNWSGYAVDGGSGSFTGVSGSWTVPLVDTAKSCPGSYSAAWVGIDGDNSNTVEQCGTEQDGNGQYYAWYEMYPKFPATVTYDVRAGDFIQAAVNYVSGSFQLTMIDWRGSAKEWSFQTKQSLKRAQRSSVEWIMEAPYSGGVLPLAKFGTIGFSGCQWAPAAGQLQSITMVNNSGQKKADILNPWSAGSFSIQYYQCQ